MVFIQEYLSVTKKNNFEGGDDYKMKMNSLISWVGGKKSIRDLIYARFPQNYGRYIEVFGEYAAEHVTTAGNMRASAEYRTLLVKVLIRRTWEAVGGMKNEY